MGKTIFIKDLTPNENIDDVFILTNIEIRQSRNGNYFMQGGIQDNSGNLGFKKWDITDMDRRLCKEDKALFARVIGKSQEFNGNVQVIVDDMIKLDPGDEDMALCLKMSPVMPKTLYDFIMRVVDEKISDEDYKKIIKYFYEKDRDKLLLYPAAKQFHHAEVGGLLHHTSRMLQAAIAISDVYKDLSKDLLFTGVILHDIEKLRELEVNSIGIAEDYTKEGKMLGHLVMGAIELDKIAVKLEIDEEKKLLLEHMMISHHYTPEFGSPRRPLFPEAEVLHHLDDMDAKLYDMREAISDIPEGEFSDKVWTLGNQQVYKHFKLRE